MHSESPKTLKSCIAQFGDLMLERYPDTARGTLLFEVTCGGYGLGLLVPDGNAKGIGYIREFGARSRSRSEPTPARMYPWYRKRLIKLLD